MWNASLLVLFLSLCSALFWTFTLGSLLFISMAVGLCSVRVFSVNQLTVDADWTGARRRGSVAWKINISSKSTYVSLDFFIPSYHSSLHIAKNCLRKNSQHNYADTAQFRVKVDKLRCLWNYVDPSVLLMKSNWTQLLLIRQELFLNDS